MPEPSSYLVAKVAAGIGGLFGGLAMMSFIKPKTILDAVIRGGVSTGSAIIFAAPLLELLNQDRGNWEFQLASGMVCGFLAWSLLGMVARFFIKAERSGEDIVDVVKRVRKTK